MKKIILFFAFTFIFAVGESLACSCAYPVTDDLRTLVKSAYQDSRAVFSGRVLEVRGNENSANIRVKFRLERVWKSKLPKNVIIRTAPDSAACGYSFVVGQRYLVYAYGTKGNLETSICTRTSALSPKNSDIAVLNKLQRRRMR